MSIDEEEQWNLPLDFDLYSTHKIRKIYYKEKRKHQPKELTTVMHDNDGLSNPYYHFNIECIETSSPLDITNTSHSAQQYDATGHCVWTGAFLLISCIDQILDIVDKHASNGNDDNITSNNEENEIIHHPLNIIELGCGTGIGGLTLMFASDSIQTTTNNNECYHHNTKSTSNVNRTLRTKIEKCCFTDTDPAVLNICRRNCELNGLILNKSFTIRELTWGIDEEHSNDHDDDENFDIILATDVLYDVDLIDPLFTTVSSLLSKSIANNGIFILSHVPRACYNDNNPPEAIEDLEKYIIDQGEKYGLQLTDIVHSHAKKSSSLSPLDNENGIDSFPEGSAILIFGRKNCSL